MGPGYDVVLVVHVLLGVVALLVNAVTAGYASAVSSRRGSSSLAARRYFRPGANWAARSLLLVPIPGFALVAMSHGGASFDQAWLVAGTALWAASAALALGVVWPAERRVQDALASGAAPPGPHGGAVPPGLDGGGAGPATSTAGREVIATRLARSGGAVTVLLLAALVLMIVQPGGG